MKRWLILFLLVLFVPVCGLCSELTPTDQWEPPVITEDCIADEPWLLVLKVAQEEIGYTEGPLSNETKYGEWFAGKRVAWCAEFLTWCVDQADARYGTSLMKNVYPWYGGTADGAPWFMEQCRFISDSGAMPVSREKQWLIGSDTYLENNSYIPQPGDYMWIYYYSRNQGPDHVAIVEGVSQDEDGAVQIHVIEGNNPDKVQRAVYALDYKLIYGFGTPVRRAYTNLGIYDTSTDVVLLQELLAAQGYIKPKDEYKTQMDRTVEKALKKYQKDHGLKVSGVWDLETRTYMEAQEDPS